MPHKADESFFDKKRPWSKKKDQILTYYLKPYLAKVLRLGRPIYLVDGFAGPGKYGDSEPGSPIYLCAQARAARGKGQSVSVLCIEENESNYARLNQLMSGFDFAATRLGRFDQHIDEIVALASANTLFLYLDPYTVEGLDWASLDRIFAEIGASGSSIEILLNFNAASFVRRGRAVLKLPDAEEDDENESRSIIDTPLERLNRIVGGDWWKQCLFANTAFSTQVHAVAETFKDRLRFRFNEVCMFPVKEKQSHSFPKYYLIFASRHPDALTLMNDSMVKAVRGGSDSMDLFASTELPKIVFECVDSPIRRADIVARVIRREPNRFLEKEISEAVRGLIKQRMLISETGNSRTNKDTIISRAPDLLA